jgi:hypothetical protein
VEADDCECMTLGRFMIPPPTAGRMSYCCGVVGSSDLDDPMLDILSSHPEASNSGLSSSTSSASSAKPRGFDDNRLRPLNDPLCDPDATRRP